MLHFYEASFLNIFPEKPQTFALMEPRQWLSYHFYPLETLDVFLIRGVRPFLEQHVWPQQGARAFFVRYDDEGGTHIRLRLHGEPAWMEAMRASVGEWFGERGRIKEELYLPNREVFRLPESLYWGEEHFHLSTRVALERMRPPYTYGDALFDALRLQVILAYAIGWDREQSARYFDALYRQWAPIFIQPIETNNGTPAQWMEDLSGLFEDNFRPQQEEIRLVVIELWDALQKRRFDLQQGEWLRWLRGNELVLAQLGSELERALPSLIHLTNNRLGVTNADEVYLAYILSRSL